MQYVFDVYDPVRGWATQANVRNLTVFEHQTLNTNSHGIRGSHEYGYERQPATSRILTVGDSYTFGDEVSDDQTYSYYLSTLIPDTEVLNLGVHGYGHDQMLLYLENEGFKYRPDVVVLGFVWFDMNRNLMAFSNYAKPKFALRGGRLQLTNVPVPDPDSIMRQEVFRSKLLDIGTMIFERLRWRSGANRIRAETISIAILDEIVNTVRRHGAIPVVAYLPVLDEILNRDPGLTVNERWVSSFCDSRRVPCVFLRQRFLAEQNRGNQFNTRSHWFANGHATAASRIAEYIEANGLLRRAAGAPHTIPEAPVALR